MKGHRSFDPTSIDLYLTTRSLPATALLFFGEVNVRCLVISLIFLSAGAGFSDASSTPLDAPQIAIIRETANSICDSIKDAGGKSSTSQIQGEVKGQLNGLLKQLASAGVSGTGSLTDETFDGLTRDATAVALSGDRDCRERVFNRMFDKISDRIAPESGYDAHLKKLIAEGLCAPGTTMIIENSKLENNGFAGLESNDPSQHICVVNSTASGNGKGGIILNK